MTWAPHTHFTRGLPHAYTPRGEHCWGLTQNLFLCVTHTSPVGLPGQRSPAKLYTHPVHDVRIKNVSGGQLLATLLHAYVYALICGSGPSLYHTTYTIGKAKNKFVTTVSSIATARAWDVSVRDRIPFAVDSMAETYVVHMCMHACLVASANVANVMGVVCAAAWHACERVPVLTTRVARA